MNKAEIQEFIARHAARELPPNVVVNLGIGIPTLCTKYLPDGCGVILQSENGIVGTDNVTPQTLDQLHVTDAGGFPAAVARGGSFIDSALSFGLIRGGHVGACVLGGLEVDQAGNLANWCIPGKKMPGMGGAMDLLVGVHKVIVAMEHTAGGQPKIRTLCTLPLTGVACVDVIITELAVIRVTPQGLFLTAYNPAYTLEQIQAVTEARLLIQPGCKPMD